VLVGDYETLRLGCLEPIRSGGVEQHEDAEDDDRYHQNSCHNPHPRPFTDEVDALEGVVEIGFRWVSVKSPELVLITLHLEGSHGGAIGVSEGVVLRVGTGVGELGGDDVALG